MRERSETVRLTRRRWDTYLLPLVFASIVMAVFSFATSSQPRFLLAPVLPLALWLMMRFSTPKAGMETRTIKATPGAIPVLSLLSVVLLLTAVLLGLDMYVFGHGLHDPLGLHPVVIIAPPLILLLCGVYVVERKSKRFPRDDQH